jgi:hypothetical protein
MLHQRHGGHLPELLSVISILLLIAQGAGGDCINFPQRFAEIRPRKAKRKAKRNAK